MSEYHGSGQVGVSAMKADVHSQTARKYVRADKPPDELQAKHTWRTRADPLEAIWPRVEPMLAPVAVSADPPAAFRGLAFRHPRVLPRGGPWHGFPAL